MKPTYYLKNNPKTETKLIIFQMKWNALKLVYSTRTTLTKDQKKYWANQRIIDNTDTRESKLFMLNKFLDNFQEVAVSKWYELKALGPVPDPSLVRQALDRFTSKERREATYASASFYELLDDFCEGKTKLLHGESRSESTLKSFETLRTHLVDEKRGFDKKKSFVFEDFNIQWRDRYMTFLQKEWNPKKPLNQNSIKTEFDKLKTILLYAVDKNLSQHRLPKGFVPKGNSDKEDEVSFTEEQIERLYRTEMPDRQTEIYRDYLVLASQTCLRLSDWGKIIEQNIVQDGGEYFLEINKTQKTKAAVIPICTELFKEIFFIKYKKSLPTLDIGKDGKPDNKKINGFIKTACSVAGLDEATSHAGRRSFANNRHNEGMSIPDIMQIGGWKTYDSFRKYMRADLKESGRKQIAHKKKQSGNPLRVAN